MARRREFTASYKRRIVPEADACSDPGAVGPLLRRERLYSSHLSDWRREVEASELASLQSDDLLCTAKLLLQLGNLLLETEDAAVSRLGGGELGTVGFVLCELLGLPTAGDVP